MPDVIEMPYRPDVFLAEKSETKDQNPETVSPAVNLEGEHYYLAGDPQSPALPLSQSSHTYRLGGPTCLAGDVVGDYGFHRELKVGDVLVFDDMAHYTMVKTTTFNGVKHPSIALLHENGEIETIRTFDYSDFRDRLS
jgi:carboxynorspermidine decarboxylase